MNTIFFVLIINFSDLLSSLFVAAVNYCINDIYNDIKIYILNKWDCITLILKLFYIIITWVTSVISFILMINFSDLFSLSFIAAVNYCINNIYSDIKINIFNKWDCVTSELKLFYVIMTWITNAIFYVVKIKFSEIKLAEISVIIKC